MIGNKETNVIIVGQTDHPRLLKVIKGALKSCIDAHGDINNQLIDSAAKRVLHQLISYQRELNKYERKRQSRKRVLMLFE